MNYLKFFLFFTISYLIGAFPSGYIFYKIKTGQDIRNKGTRENIGATNVFLCGGVFIGILTLIFDIAKGFLPVFIAQILFNNTMVYVLAGIIAIIGHVFPIYIGFKGGTGLATTLGVLLALMPEIMFVYLIIFMLFTPIIRRPALLGLILMLLLPFFALILNYSKLIISISAFMGIIYFIVSLTHITSILKGNEYNEVMEMLFRS